MPPSHLDSLAAYLPIVLRQRVTRDPAPITEASADRYPACVLFADISGFTALTEQLAGKGAEGVEILTGTVNAYFGRLIDRVLAAGGDVFKFAGDALTAVWPADGSPGSLEEAAHRAVFCAQQVQAELRSYRTPQGQPLLLKTGLGAGDVYAAHVGGQLKRWEFFLTGSPMTQAGLAEVRSRPGQVVLSGEIWDLVRDRAAARPAGEGFYLLEAVRPPAETAPLRADIRPGMESALQAFIPGAILHRLAAGQEDWLAEIRQITVLLAHLPQITAETPIEEGQQVMEALQRTLYRYEGSLNKLSVDDKGVILVAAFGLQPFSHEDDPARGALTAMEMVAALRAMGVRCSIGVTTGRAFCGVIGNEKRREYTMMGNVVNRAARLMDEAASLPGDYPVLCDTATVELSDDRVSYENLEARQLKGIQEQVAVFRPEGEKRSGQRTRTSLVGRSRELLQIGEQLQGLLRGESSILVIEGEAGIGKSRLVEEIVQQSDSLGLTHYTGKGDAVERTTPYYAWRTVFSSLFGIDASMDSSTQTTGVLKQMRPLWRVIDRAPLLNPVLPFSIPENELTGQMQGQVRADNTRLLMREVMRDAFKNRAAVLIIEDAHWLDSASWSLLRAVHGDIRPLLLVVAARPAGLANQSEFVALRDSPESHILRLEPLPGTEIEPLLQQRLGVATLDPRIVHYVAEKAEGHPFFSEELAYALRDSGMLVLEGEKGRLKEDLRSLDELGFPETIQGVITSRIDRLEPREQFALKVASVVGREFDHHTVHSIHPIPEDRPALHGILDKLDRLDITHLEQPEPAWRYMFKHITTQEVAYNMMAFSQRRQLHHALGEFYEQEYAEDLSGHFPLLAHHWAQAEVPDKTVDYLYKAGVQALRGFANREAIRFFSEILEWADRNPDAHSRRERVRWHRLLGVAYQATGRFKKSIEHLETAAQLLGVPVPHKRRFLYSRIIADLARQAFRRTWLQPLPESGELQESGDTIEMVRIYDELAFIYFLSDDTARMVFVDLEMLNAAGSIGVRQELARTLNSVGVMAGLAGLHGIADAFAERAQEAVEKLNHAPTTVRVILGNGLYKIGLGRWEEVERSTGEAQKVSRQIGDQRQYGEATVILAMKSLLAGDIDSGLERYRHLEEHARESSNPMQLVWALDGQVIVHLIRGEFDAAVGPIRAAGEAALANIDHASIIYNHGYAAYVHFHRGEFEEAVRHASTALEQIERSLPLVYSMVYSLNWIDETLLRLWERSGDPEFRKKSRALLKHHRRFMRSFPISRPGFWRNRGHYARISGRPKRAAACWRRSLRIAGELAMPYELALAHALLAEVTSGTEQEENRRKAGVLNARMGIPPGAP